MRILTRYMPSTLAPAMLVAGLLALASPAHATSYSVGPDSACTHSTLAGALAAAVADSSAGPHTIRMMTDELAEHSLEIADPAQDIVIDGGYSNCTLLFPHIGVTTLNAGGAGQIFRITNSGANPRRTVTLRQLELTGGDATFGGAIGALGKVTVALESGVTIINNMATEGGGIRLYSTPQSEDPPWLEIRGNVVISHNEAIREGGGVYARGSSQVTIESAKISNNTAREKGGGIALIATAELFINAAGSDSVLFESNTAGEATFDANEGFGGAIYSDRGKIEASVPPPSRVGLAFDGNEANFGGAVYVRGSDDPSDGFTSVLMQNTMFQFNHARGKGGALYLRNAVDVTVRPSLSGPSTPCEDFAFPGTRGIPTSTFGLCSGFLYNSSELLGGGGLEGGGAAYLEHSVSAPRPALRVAGAFFGGNEDEGGAAAVVAAIGDSSVRLLRNVFIDNDATSPWSNHMIRSAADVLFVYNTVLSHSSDLTLFGAFGGEVDVTGSILYSPGTDLISTGTMVHNGCLLAHTDDGVPDPGGDGVIIGQDPRVEYPSWRPHKDSPAVDVCGEGRGDNFWPPYLDGQGLSVPVNVRSPGDQVLGPYDLGAIELRESMFSDRFETP